MKFKRFGRVLLASVVSTGLVFSITACGVSHTVDYVFVTASKGNAQGIGQISVYRVDSQSGALTQVPDSPFLSGGKNPVAETTTPDGQKLFVANQLDNTIVQFKIGVDGKLYPEVTINTPGSEPTALSVSPDGSYLFVTDNYRPNAPAYTDLNPGPGGLIVYPLDKTKYLGTGTPVANGNTTFWPLPFAPAGVTVLSTQSTVYVVSKSGAAPGTNGVVTAFHIGSGGVLSTVAGSPFPAGTTPNSLANDPLGRFLYVTDGASNQLINYGIRDDGVLVPLITGTTTTGGFPDSVTVEPRGKFLYVANYNDPSIFAYAIDQAKGTPSAVATTGTSSGTYTARTGPTCVLVEPALGKYLYVSNFLDDTVTGIQIDPNTGAMTATQGPDYKASPQPTCVAAVTHGNHALQHLQN